MSKMHTPRFLSIDMDYWNKHGDDLDKRAQAYLDKVAKCCIANGIPMTCVMNHVQMLDEVNTSGATELFNMDMHSDLADKDCRYLNVGTWVGYVKWRRRGSYIWARGNSLLCQGECNGSDDMFNFREKIYKRKTDWGNVVARSYRKGEPDLATLMKDTIKVCVCMSPYYSDERLEKVFQNWRHRWDVPYRWGRRDEGQERRVAASDFVENGS